MKYLPQQGEVNKVQREGHRTEPTRLSLSSRVGIRCLTIRTLRRTTRVTVTRLTRVTLGRLTKVIF